MKRPAVPLSLPPPPTCISYRRFTPVVVSSETPTTCLPILVHFMGSFFKLSRIRPSTILNSGLSVELGSGIVPLAANSASALVPSARQNAGEKHISS